MEHTLLPWMASNKNALNNWLVYPNNSKHSLERTKANAEFIVKACNSHYDLLLALKIIHDELHEKELNIKSDEFKIWEICSKAIKKAEGDS